MLKGQETEIETIEFRQLEVEFDLVTASDPSVRGLNHIRSGKHSRLIAIDNKIGRLYFAIENAIGWTDISHALEQRKMEGNRFNLDDQENVIQLSCSNGSLLAATTKRILKLSVEGNAAKLAVEKDLSLQSFIIIGERICALLHNSTIEYLDLQTLKHLEDDTCTGTYVALCTDGHKVYFATTEGVIEDFDGGSYGSIGGVNGLYCTLDGVLIATKDRDIFIYHSDAWTHFSNPTRISSIGKFDIESISGWHPELPLLIIASHSTSPEFAVFGVVDDSPFLFVLGVEDALPQFPLSSIDPDCDCCPVSLALDFTSSQSIITSDEVSLPPLPIIWSLTTDGTLVPFRIVRRGADETRIFSGMHPLRVKQASPGESNEDKVGEGQRAPSLLPTQKPSLQVIENIQLEATATKKEPDAIPVTMDLGGIQNLIVQEFMKIHGWIERDLHKLKTLAYENRELSRQIQEETLRLLKARSIGDEPCKLVDEDLLLAEEFGKFDNAWLLRVQKASRELHLTHGRLQALLDASTGTNLESRLQSTSLDDVTGLKPLVPESSLPDIQSRLEQLGIVTEHLSTGLNHLQGNYTPKVSKQTPIKGFSQDSRELLKTKLMRRPASLTAISEGATIPTPKPTQLEYKGDLSIVQKILAARNKTASTNMQAEEVTAVAEALSKQDTSIFKFTTSSSNSPPERITKEKESEHSETKSSLGTSSPSSKVSTEKKVIFGKPPKPAIETSAGPEKPVDIKFEFAMPSISSTTDMRTDRSIYPTSTPSIKSSETATSREPLLPTINAPAFSFAPLRSPSSALSLSSESTTLRSSEAPQEPESSIEHKEAFKQPPRSPVHDEDKSPILVLETSPSLVEARMAVPPIPKLFAMIRKKEAEETHKDMPPPTELDHERGVQEGTRPSISEEPFQSDVREDTKEEESPPTDQPTSHIQELDILSSRLDSIDAFAPEETAAKVDSSLDTLGKPLQDQGKVRTVFGVTQAQQDTFQSTIPSTVQTPFGDQQFTFNSTFGQYAIPPPTQPQFGSPQESSALPPPPPSLGFPHSEQPSFGQHTFGQSSFAPIGSLNPPQPIQGGTFASYSSGTNAFANLAQQSSHKQPEGQEKKPSLPSSFTTFRD